jgi:hypothetical protein
VCSPQSNGIAEAFVKTFKRDYVRLSARPDATALLAEHDRWFEDYNEMHAQRALEMLRSDGDNSSLHTARDLQTSDKTPPLQSLTIASDSLPGGITPEQADYDAITPASSIS